MYLRADHFDPSNLRLGDLLQRFTAAHPERFSSAEQVGPVRIWQLPLSGVRGPKAAADVLTTGDAGQLVDPLTGEGIFQALESGRLAGENAATAIRQRGHINSRSATRYRLMCQRRLAWPGTLRSGIQDGIQLMLRLQLYRLSWVQRALRWGYGGGGLELTKRVTALH